MKKASDMRNMTVDEFVDHCNLSAVDSRRLHRLEIRQKAVPSISCCCVLARGRAGELRDEIINVKNELKL